MKRANIKVLAYALPLCLSALAVPAVASGAARPPGASVSPATRVTVNVAFPLRHERALAALTTAQATPGSAQFHRWLTPAQFKQRYGISHAESVAITRQLRADGLTARADGAQALAVTGSAAKIARAFGGRLERVSDRNGRTRIASAVALRPTGALARFGGTVIGLQPTIRMRALAEAAPNNRYGAGGPYWADDLKQAYQYPAYGKPVKGGATGAGATVGIIMASAPNPTDFAKYFAHEHLTAPTLTVVPVNGGAPFDPNSGVSQEVSLDTQQAGGIAPGAQILAYNLPDLSDQSIFSGYVDAIETNQVDVLSSSFGECELFYTAAYNGGQDYTGILRSYHDLYLQANAQGITVVASSGDSGSLECTTPSYFSGQPAHFIRGVSEPASDPNVTAVGGTNLLTTHTPGSLNSAYLRENENGNPEIPYDPFGVGSTVSGGYWGSGGGFASLFAEPSWQYRYTNNRTGQRALPDVSLQMGGCPGGIAIRSDCNLAERSYVVTYVGGQPIGLIGTSVSAPDFAGTVALYDEVHHSRAGNINPVLYAFGSAQRAGTLGFQVFHENIPGYTGYYSTAYTASGAKKKGGFDEVLGNGTLIAKNFIFGTSRTPAAGIPQTPTNP